MAIKMVRKGATQGYPDSMKCPNCGKRVSVELQEDYDSQVKFQRCCVNVKPSLIPTYSCNQCGAIWVWELDAVADTGPRVELRYYGTYDGLFVFTSASGRFYKSTSLCASDWKELSDSSKKIVLEHICECLPDNRIDGECLDRYIEYEHIKLVE